MYNSSNTSKFSLLSKNSCLNTYSMTTTRMSLLKKFDETKAGVKGLVDERVTKLPQFFIHPPETLQNNDNVTSCEFPVLDFQTLSHKERTEKVLEAASTWGFFLVVNHGIPDSVMDGMLSGVRQFHEQDMEIKKKYYSRDFTKNMIYNSNFDLYSAQATCWRDSFNCIMAPVAPTPDELPAVCSEILLEYGKQVMELGRNLFMLLSEALGLNPDHLLDMDCAQTLALFGHYYPACPEPHLTLGTRRHSDYCFLTVLLQDSIGGRLQVLHENKWIDVPVVPGALVINIGDLLQLISNGKFTSVEHRVLAGKSGPRVSLASFFGRDTCGVNSRVYGPIEELLSEDNPPKYRSTTIKDYTTHCRSISDRSAAMDSMKI